MLRSFIRCVPKSTVRLQRRSMSLSVLRYNSSPRTRRPLFLSDTSNFGATRLSHPTLLATFHSTQKNEGGPLVGLLAALLKVRNFFVMVS
jgi:hypothetical protein